MKALIIGGVVLGVLILVGGCTALVGVGARNGAITKQETAMTNWGQVENQYQRRLDLVPNLVATVKGYADHERETLGGVTESRSKVGQIHIDPSKATPEQFAAYQRAQGDFTNALSKLMVVVENYPNLKADQNFLALQSQLEGTENRIAVERKRYNDAVKDYNIHIRKWPKSMFVGGFERMQLFEAEEGAKRAPKVDFGK